LWDVNLFVIRYLVVYVNILPTPRDIREHLNRTSNLLFMVYLYTQLVVCPIKHDPVIENHNVEGSCHPNLCTVVLQPLLLCMNEHNTPFVQIIHLRRAIPCFRSKSLFFKQLVKFASFYGTGVFIKIFTRARHLSLSEPYTSPPRPHTLFL
jgi:hypothetical protein